MIKCNYDGNKSDDNHIKDNKECSNCFVLRSKAEKYMKYNCYRGAALGRHPTEPLKDDTYKKNNAQRLEENKLNTDLSYYRSLQTELKKFIIDLKELSDVGNDILNRYVTFVFQNCIKYSLEFDEIIQDKLLEIESVIDILNDELNTGHWSKVPLCTRKYFTIASFMKCLTILKIYELHTISTSEQMFNDLNILIKINSEILTSPGKYNLTRIPILKTCLKCLDVGLLLGAPLENNPDLLTDSAKYLRKELNKLHSVKNNINNIKEEQIKRKVEEPLEFLKLKGKMIDCLECPSLESFNKYYFVPQIPVLLKGCMQHWPASTKWTDINYLLEVAGDRTVPIEIGSQYVDENWSQKLMTFKEFISAHYLSENGNIGYLAQHNLFEQITELKEDICIPEYCCLSLNYDTSCEPDVNAWFGPKGTVSPLHTDPKNNLLAQVYGTKQVILFAPRDTSYLYPHEDKLLDNTAQVNPVEPDLEKYPEFSKATMFKCLLEPGDMLFIPVKWWHHVTAFDKSFSVSFWWQ